MHKDYSQELTPEVREKMKKNLVYVGIFSIVMIFAGFTSAYIVSMGDTFWVKYPLPSGFWISTLLILLSSLFYHLGIKSIRAGNSSRLKAFMLATLLAGIGFGIFQFVGYGQLVQSGANFTGSSIFVTEGHYGDYYEIKYKGQFLDVASNQYLLNGKPLTAAESQALKAYVKPFEKTADPKGYSIPALQPGFVLYYNSQPLTLQNGKLLKPDGTALQYTDMLRLQYLSWNIRDDRGDFFHKGELGKDFHVYYKGKELLYKNQDLKIGNKRLSAPLQMKANQSRDTATSYLYIITVLHLLHIVGALFYLLKMTSYSFTGKFTAENNLSLRLGAIFWHFLGLLWIYLLVFLLFIH